MCFENRNVGILKINTEINRMTICESIENGNCELKKFKKMLNKLKIKKKYGPNNN